MNYDKILDRLEKSIIVLGIIAALTLVVFMWTCNPIVRDVLLIELVVGVIIYFTGDFIDKNY